MLLAEELLLISLDDEKGTDRTNWGVDAGLAGALLLELAAGGHLKARDGDLVAAGGPPPAEPLPAEALAEIAASERPRGAKHWVGQLPKRLKPLRGRVADRLVSRGVLEEQRHKVMGLIPTTRYPERDPGPERALRERLRAALLEDREPDERTALLIGLLHPLHLVDRVVDKPDRQRAKQRAEQIADRGVVGGAVESAVKEAQAAIMVATTAGAVAATTAST